MLGLSSRFPQQEVSFISRLHGPTQELMLFLPSSMKLLSVPAGLTTRLSSSCPLPALLWLPG